MNLNRFCPDQSVQIVACRKGYELFLSGYINHNFSFSGTFVSLPLKALPALTTLIRFFNSTSLKPLIA